MQALPLILVPGLMCDHAVWAPVLPWLSGSRTCTVADHGSADSLQQMARQILDATPGRMLLAGHSMGVRVVLEAQRLAPGRISGVALLDTGYLPRPAGPAGLAEEQKRLALLQIAREQGVRVMAREWVQGMVDADRLGDAELIDRIVEMFARQSADVFACQIKALLARPDGGDVLRALAVPTLILCGAQDAWSPLTQHQAMQAMTPSGVLEVIDHAGHMAPMERPREVAQALDRWLASCESSTLLTCGV